MNKTILKIKKYIKNEAFREYSHLQGYSRILTQGYSGILPKSFAFNIFLDF